jgi:CheY-like chemotaxis protein
VALINLAVNARDAMPEGGRLVVQAANVHLSPQRDEGTNLSGDFVRIQVTDTGTGIPAESLSRIFEPFYTTKDPSKGTGLGLSQVHGFAQQSGGALRVESEFGRGATFSLYLPRAAQISIPSVQPATSHNRTGGGRVLLVEDNPDVAQVTMGMLEALGYQITAVQSAAAALDRQEVAVDVVLSDIVLGDGPSGLDLAEQLRERRPDLPVVLMTGYSEALAKGRRLGLKVLNKPFGEADLAAALASARDERVAGANRSNVVQLPR